MEILLLLLLGIIAGILAGLLGVGGGLVIVPVLIWIFQGNAEIPVTKLMHFAIGTSLATIVFTSMSSIIAHHRRGAVQWFIVWQLTPGIIVGTLLGSILADALPSDLLQKFFACFVLFVSVQMGYVSHRKIQPHPVPNVWGLSIVGVVIGKISALVGIGGGTLTVPFLIWCHMPIRIAIATSAACGFPIALSGSVGFFANGYIYWPAFLAIIPTTLLCAPLGAKIAHSIPVNMLKKVFAVFLACVGLHMLLT
ncbi:MAG: sulfite exporter TauE/SafE family protein [Thiomargarita sp.]|nr:sulfite exporter TauE/SafE family protein [Thiomargarita sp.]